MSPGQWLYLSCSLQKKNTHFCLLQCKSFETAPRRYFAKFSKHDLYFQLWEFVSLSIDQNISLVGKSHAFSSALTSAWK